MRRILILFLFCGATGIAGAQEGAPATAAEFAAASPYRSARLTYKIIPAAGGTWCYDVYADGKMMIHQPSIPGLPGAEGFKTRAGAGKVAQLVIAKIRKGAMPPSITLPELKKLDVL